MLKLAVCDDEISAVQDLSSKIKLFMDSRDLEYTLSQFSCGESLLTCIAARNMYFDAVFLDIRMDRMNGMDTAKEIRKTNGKTNIIFVTAIKEYVFDAFDVGAANYLIKPIEAQKLQKTLDKLAKSVFLTDTHFLVIHKSGEIIKIPFPDIFYSEVVNHRVFVYEQNSTYEYGAKIDDLETKLTDDFFRCHRSYIVNMRYVESYSDGFAYLTSGEKIPIATRRQPSFMKALLHYQRKEMR
ncbi:MAG TPA: LytTR family DNA-binding domain-containing protein [Clostridia bacterium]|nr:LytTR family DNA-binding domain-containing protein [Clostridia bacterium]